MAQKEDRLQTREDTYKEKRRLLLKDLDRHTIQKAWFTIAHLLLSEDAKVVDMGCDDGAMTYAMAALYPDVEFVGLDKSKRKINRAKEQFKLPNLSYKVGDASSEIFEKESLDAIINSYILHEVYSGSRYNEQIVSDTLRKQFKMLKKNGIMFIRDYAEPVYGDYVLLEMPDKPSKGKELSELSEADLLIWYAEHARPRHDPGCGGFFLEELPERIPKTRLFRLPSKWAYEFIMRKDNRDTWDDELPMEYTFFTESEFRKELRSHGARVQYSGPYWDEDIMTESFDGRFRLYSDPDGAPLGNPPTCFLAVCYKMDDRKSLFIEERRPNSSNKSNLKITAMRDKTTGEINDVVSRDIDLSEIIPYRIDHNGHLKIYLYDGVTRSIANAVPRGGINFDGRKWSGHMVEPIAVDSGALAEVEKFDVPHSAKFAKEHLGILPQEDAILEHGPDYYPAPDLIDEKVHTYYIKSQKSDGFITPKNQKGVNEKFTAKGIIREFDAQQVLDAITVGMIPNSRLELQILTLFQQVGIESETWVEKKLELQVSELVKPVNYEDILKEMNEEDDRFKAVKGTTGDVRAIQSTFVEEGQTRGSVAGLSAESVDFIVHDGKTVNTAVILPLTQDLKGQIHAGFNIKHLPVPQRHEGNGMTIAAPSLNIPPEVTNQKQLKRFIANEYGIETRCVFKLGESYFSHLGISPMRIHPFAIAAPPEMLKDPGNSFLPFYQMMLLQRAIWKEPHMMTVLARSYRYFHDDLQLEAKMDVNKILKSRFDKQRPNWAMPVSAASEVAHEIMEQRLKDRLQERENEEIQQRLEEQERLREMLEGEDDAASEVEMGNTYYKGKKKKKKKKKSKKKGVLVGLKNIGFFNQTNADEDFEDDEDELEDELEHEDENKLSEAEKDEKANKEKKKANENNFNQFSSVDSEFADIEDDVEDEPEYDEPKKDNQSPSLEKW